MTLTNFNLLRKRTVEEAVALLHRHERRMGLKPLLLILILLGTASLSFAQETKTSTIPGSPAEPVQFHAQGAFLAAIVPDLDASIRWYKENLGLKPVKRARSPRVAAENAVLVGNNFFVELIHFDDPAMNKKDLPEKFALGYTKSGVIVSKEDFDKLVREFQQRKLEFMGGVFEDKEMGVWTFIIKDNSGNKLQFFMNNKN